MHDELMISFVIIAYNEADRIAQALRSIQELEALEDYEIIVVDDGSGDGTCKVVKDLAVVDGRILLVQLGMNRGRGAARAAGVGAASGRYIAMVDADIILPKDWWLQCWKAIKDYDAVSGTAVPDGDVVYLSDRLHLEPKAAPATTAITGNNAVFRREVFDRVHYEEDLRNGEDVALGYAMESCGLTRFVVPGLTVLHHEDKTLLQSLSWLFESGIGASRQLETYRKIRRPDQATALLVGLALNVLVPGRSSRRARVGLLLCALLTVTVFHVRTKFVFRRKNLARYAVGVLTDALLICSYVCGRVVGHGYICRRTKR